MNNCVIIGILSIKPSAFSRSTPILAYKKLRILLSLYYGQVNLCWIGKAYEYLCKIRFANKPCSYKTDSLQICQGYYYPFLTEYFKQIFCQIYLLYICNLLSLGFLPTNSAGYSGVEYLWIVLPHWFDLCTLAPT